MCLFISAGKFTAFLAASVHCFYRLKALAVNIHLASFQIFHPSVCRIHYIPVTISVLRPTFALFGLNLSNHVHDLDQAYKFGSFCRMKLWYNCWFIVHFIWRHLRTFSYLKQSILISYSHKKKWQGFHIHIETSIPLQSSRALINILLRYFPLIGTRSYLSVYYEIFYPFQDNFLCYCISM